MVTRVYYRLHRPSRRWLLHFAWLCLAATLCLGLTGRAAQAQRLVYRELTDEILDGKLKIQTPPGSKVQVSWTDVNGADLKGKEQNFIMPEGGQHTVDVPVTVNGSLVLDAWVFHTKPKGGLGADASSSTHFEAYFRSDTDLLITRFTSAAWELTSGNGWIVCPVAYADTNGDGTVGLGDQLYSMVNLYEYTQAGMPIVNVGDTIDIVNGMSSAYPGMYFGLEPIVPDATVPSGYSNPSPVTLTGTIGGTQSVAGFSAPEPATCSLIAGPAVLLAARRMRRRRR